MIWVEIDAVRICVLRDWQNVWDLRAKAWFHIEELNVVWASGDFDIKSIRPSSLARAAHWITIKTGRLLSVERLVAILNSYALSMQDYSRLGFVLSEDMCRQWFEKWECVIPPDYWHIHVELDDEIPGLPTQLSLFTDER